MRSTARELAACERLKLERTTLSPRSREDFPHLAEEHHADIEQALRLLPPAQRAAVEAYVIQGDSYAQIAGSTGATESAVRQNVSRGLGRLRARLERNR
jgi:RNA polymerase sigma factor (sigma-70 family)